MSIQVLGTAALDYMRAGLHVLALDGKRPNARIHGDHWSWDDSFWGEPDGIMEMAALERAFERSSGTTGIAILIPEHFLVADVDTEEAGALFAELGGQITNETVASVTKNGIHVWYYAPGASRNRWLGSRTLLLKGFGGYVVGPPSLHFGPDGEQDWVYRWGDSPLVVGGRLQQPEDIPPAMAKMLQTSEAMEAAMEKDRPATATWEYKPVSGVPWYQWDREFTYNIGGLEQAIIHAADGNQNNVIHWAAMTAREEGVPLDVSMTRLLAAAEKGGHPRRRAIDTIRGAYKRA